MAAYYNEIDPYAAQWLRNLIAAGHIAQGEVDERSICDVDSADLADFTQCHFFAGIGVWSLALRLAGWPDDRPVWTGSCPCQPFSAAGKRDGFSDERHLWPHLFRLIAQCRPPVVFGEQVASRDGLEWLDLVQADLEGADYASAAVDICAAGVGAPHIRQRLYWVADAVDQRREREPHIGCASVLGTVVSEAKQRNELSCNSASPSSMADADDARLEGRLTVRQRADECAAGPGGVVGGLADTSGRRSEMEIQQTRNRIAETELGQTDGFRSDGASHRAGPTNGHWADVDWLYCRDDKWRPVEPGTFPLAHGATARVGRLRAYGNAIVPQVAGAVIRAYMQ